MSSANFRKSILIIVGAAAICLAIVVFRAVRGPSGGLPARHVIVVSFDTARADHLGCYGNAWIKTPRIDELASESILFEDYMTVVPMTLASHTSLLTGKYPHTHGAPRNGYTVNEENVMLPEILKEEGFHTAGFAASFVLSARFGFAQGFDYYDEDFSVSSDEHVSYPSERVAAVVTDAAIAYLEEREVPENLFLFLHYFDPHKPYRPPAEYVDMYEGNETVTRWLEETEGVPRNRYAEMRMALHYAGEVTYMDEHFGRMMDYLDGRGILEEALLIVTSDHGDNFWGHPVQWDHGFTVYQSTVDAICIIRLPQARNGGKRIEHLFASIDVMPSVLSFLGLEAPAGTEGRSIDLTASSIPPPRTNCFCQASKSEGVAETDPQWLNIRKAACIREGKWKYVSVPYQGTEELYDLSRDPGEHHDLLADPTPMSRAQADRLRPVLRTWVESAAPLPSSLAEKDREDTIRRLKSLGYL